jgi:hypothetical protein
MLQAQTKCLTIATALDISRLPIDVTDKRTGINFTPSRMTPASAVAFRSLADESTVRRSIPLPEGQLSVFCGSPCFCPPAVKAIEAAQTSPATNQTSEKPATKPQPGFEVGAAIIGLIIGIYIYKKQQDN